MDVVVLFVQNSPFLITDKTAYILQDSAHASIILCSPISQGELLGSVCTGHFHNVCLKQWLPVIIWETAYKGLVCAVLEYGSCVCDPQGVVLQKQIEKVQNRAARFVSINYWFETGRMTAILEKTKMGVSEEKEERQ